jgi:hypothetical protein
LWAFSGIILIRKSYIQSVCILIKRTVILFEAAIQYGRPL